MTEPTLIKTLTLLPIDQIELRDRLRPVSAAGVGTIVASIREIGQLANPVVVRQMRRGGETQWTVLDGAHRLAAARELGWIEVPVRVFECTDDQARILEIDGNLSGAELNPLDTAVFLATRKTIYERLHPETRRGIAGGLARQGSATDTMSVAFVTSTAEKFGLTERHVRRIVAAGMCLGPDEVAKLRRAPRQVTLKDLQDIAKVGLSTKRDGVVDALATGSAKSAAAALKAMEASGEEAAKDPVQDQLSALSRAWGRAGMAARRLWIAEVFAELSPLVVDEAETRDADEIAILRRSMAGAAA